MTREYQRKLELLLAELQALDAKERIRRAKADIKAANSRIAHSKKTKTKGVIRFRARTPKWKRN